MISANQLKRYQSLFQKKYRYREKKFLIEGVNLCEAALDHDANIELILVGEDSVDKPGIPNLMKSAQTKLCPMEVVPNATVNKLSESVTPQGIVAVIRIGHTDAEALWQNMPPEVLILDRVSDPGNLGSILRTASWFGVQAVGLSKRCVDVLNAKVLRSSAGAFFSLPVVIGDLELLETLAGLIQRHYQIYVSSPQAQRSFAKTPFERPFALIMGSERQGVDNRTEEMSSLDVGIPGSGQMESLNVAVSTGILLAEAFRPRF